MTPYETKLAEFSLVRSMPKMMVSSVKGKVKGKLETVSKKIDRYWKKERETRTATEEEVKNAMEAINKFQAATGWKKGGGKDIATLLLFGQAILEDAEFDPPAGVIEALTDLIFHFESHPDPKRRPAPGCYWGADLAAEKWQRIKGGG